MYTYYLDTLIHTFLNHIYETLIEVCTDHGRIFTHIYIIYVSMIWVFLFFLEENLGFSQKLDW